MTDNPFLLPPGARPMRRAEMVLLTPNPPTPPARNREGYIAVPPSVESATHRIDRPATAPVGPSPVEPQIAEETHLAPRSAPSPSCALVLPDGTRVPVLGPVLLGRNPAPIADRPGARLLALSDLGKTVSKTHALFEPNAGGIRIQDLHSTNGVAITQGGGRTVLPSGADGIALPGAVVELGSFTIRIDAPTNAPTDAPTAAPTTAPTDPPLDSAVVT